jgi:hypothetical protein
MTVPDLREKRGVALVTLFVPSSKVDRLLAIPLPSSTRRVARSSRSEFLPLCSQKATGGVVNYKERNVTYKDIAYATFSILFLSLACLLLSYSATATHALL